jgi:hypothetical protein
VWYGVWCSRLAQVGLLTCTQAKSCAGAVEYFKARRNVHKQTVKVVPQENYSTTEVAVAVKRYSSPHMMLPHTVAIATWMITSCALSSIFLYFLRAPYALIMLHAKNHGHIRW